DTHILACALPPVNMDFHNSRSTIQNYRYPPNNAVFRLQVPGREPAHYQAVQEVERELPGGVVTARQIEHFMRQIELPKAVQNLPRVHRKKGAVVAGPDQERLQIAALKPLQVAGR